MPQKDAPFSYQIQEDAMTNTNASDPHKEPDNSEFLAIGRDPASAKMLRDSMESLAKIKGDSPLKEMAQEILSGRVGIREAISIPAYAEALTQGIQDFKEKWDGLSDSEREELAAKGEQELSKIEQELSGEQQENRRPTGKSRHDAQGWSLY